MARRIIGSLLAVCLLVGALVVANARKGDERRQLHDEMLTEIQTLPDYPTHSSLYNEWLDEHHDACFDSSHAVGRDGGGRGRAAAGFDSDAYLDDLFSSMARSAASEGYEEQAAHLRELREGLYLIEREQ